jgi:hypothetical protein
MLMPINQVRFNQTLWYIVVVNLKISSTSLLLMDTFIPESTFKATFIPESMTLILDARSLSFLWFNVLYCLILLSVSINNDINLYFCLLICSIMLSLQILISVGVEIYSLILPFFVEHTNNIC